MEYVKLRSTTMHVVLPSFRTTYAVVHVRTLHALHVGSHEAVSTLRMNLQIPWFPLIFAREPRY